MAKKILIDTNIWVDLIARRTLFLKESNLALTQLIKNGYQLFVSSTTITDIYYLCRKELDSESLNAAIDTLIENYNLAVVDKAILKIALKENKKQKDFEDAVQAAAGSQYLCTHILTRNSKDFDGSLLIPIEPRNVEEIIG